MKEINITIRDKIAENVSGSGYVCGNSDYTVVFDFDAEWDEFDTKTARFVKQDRTFTDVVFSGNQCPMPILSNTYNIYVGVFAGDLHTTTPAHISAKKSILCDGGTPAAPAEDVYAQILERLNNIEQPAADDIQYQATIEETPVENVAQALDLLKEGAGGAKTWADLGETIDFEIEWDGSAEGREVISRSMSDDVTLNYYKVSDEYLTADQLVGAVMTVSGVADSAVSSFLPETYTITAEDVSTEDMGVVFVGYQYGIIWVASIPSGTEYGSQGVYVLLARADSVTEIAGGNVTFTEDIYATKLRKADIHTIPVDYLPESVAADISTAQSTAEAAQSTAEAAQSTAETAQSTAETAQSTAETAQKDIDKILSGDEQTASFSFDMIIQTGGPKDENFELKKDGDSSVIYYLYKDFSISGDRVRSAEVTYYAGNTVRSNQLEIHEGAFSIGPSLKLLKSTPKYPIIVVSGTSNVTINGVSVSPPKAGIYGLYEFGLYPKTVSITYERSYVMLDSVSAGSTKRFRITVDDSGTLSATEVTD